MSRAAAEVLYTKYNSVRRPEFRIATEICEDDRGLFVRKRATDAWAKDQLESLRSNAEKLQGYYRDIKVILPEKTEDGMHFPYIQGQTLAEQIDAGALDKDAFIALVNEKLDRALDVREEYRCAFAPTAEFEAMFGKTEIGSVPAVNPASDSTPLGREAVMANKTR